MATSEQLAHGHAMVSQVCLQSSEIVAKGGEARVCELRGTMVE